MPSTELVIDGISIPDYAARGITVQVAPIASGALRRDVNGNLIDLTLPEHRKRAVSMSCSDQDAPLLLDVWRGKEIDITLIEGMGLEETGGPITITAMVDVWDVRRNEWGAVTDWTMTALEV